MSNFTTNTYEMKRDIVKFSNKLCKNSNKPETKFITDMIYGISKSKDILLSSIAEALNEDTKKAYTINRLSDNLVSDLTASIDVNYTNLVIDALGDTPVFLVDDSDIVKPLGKKFENLGIVRDGSSRKKSYEKGYHHTEIVGLTKDMKQPISIFSKIHSSTQKEFISNNRITYEGLDKVVSLLDERNLKGIFVNDRGYDSNEIFNYYFSKKQYFVIRLTEKRKIYRNHKWYKITTLRDAFKGKIKINLMFQGEEKECAVSIVKSQITAQKKWINIIFIYGLSDTPMMLASNIPVRSKEDVIKIARNYMNRWRIEEYFKFKKQEYNFENFRVRTLKAINNLNKMLTYTIGLIALLSEKIEKREFVNRIIKESKSLKDTVFLWFYQLARGIYNILSMARTGIRKWENIRKIKTYDGQLSLL
ncbi:MAG TPA: transposase [Firmicutes bacterium]|nr:transposase [Bacillota bacterium]